MAGTVPPTGARFRAPRFKSSCFALFELPFARLHQTCELPTGLCNESDQLGRGRCNQPHEHSSELIERRQFRKHFDLRRIDRFAIDNAGLERKDVVVVSKFGQEALSN